MADQLPITVVATVTFRSYSPDEDLAARVRACIQTHPTLSFLTDSVTVDRLLHGDDPDRCQCSCECTSESQGTSLLCEWCERDGHDNPNGYGL